jgi:hypothetical protein
MADKVEQDGYLVITFKDDTQLTFAFKDIANWALWGTWIIIKYKDHRVMYFGDTISDIDVVYNSDMVVKGLTELPQEDAFATRISCVSCHEKMLSLPATPDVEKPKKDK